MKKAREGRQNTLRAHGLNLVRERCRGYATVPSIRTETGLGIDILEDLFKRLSIEQKRLEVRRGTRVFRNYCIPVNDLPALNEILPEENRINQIESVIKIAAQTCC